MTAAPANWMNGTAESSPTTAHVRTGVCNLGLTFDNGFENGSWSSRAMPNASRIVDVRIDMQHTKIAADTISRYRVEPKLDMTDSITCCGPVANEVTAAPMSGTAMRTPQRNTAPITNAPITEPSTALGASTRGLRVSSARVDAVSNP